MLINSILMLKTRKRTLKMDLHMTEEQWNNKTESQSERFLNVLLSSTCCEDFANRLIHYFLI